jgi:hypothetical protein
MLPSLHKLSPTGEFHALGWKEAKEWNEQNPQGDAFSHDKIPANCYPDTRNCEPTFRVWVADPVTGNKGTTKYNVYLAQPLWQWYQQNPTDPINRQYCWSEDWVELKAKYGLPGVEPKWVKYLPSYNRVNQLQAEKRTYLYQLRQAEGFGVVSYMNMYNLAGLLIGPDGTFTEDGSTENAQEGWVATFAYEEALRIARWLLEADVLSVISRNLLSHRSDLRSPILDRWATQLLKALQSAVAQRGMGENADLTELHELNGRILDMPELLQGLVEYAYRITVEFAEVSSDENPWELLPLRVLYNCALSTLEEESLLFSAQALATDQMLETFELIFRPRPDMDTASANYDYVWRNHSKLLALTIVHSLSSNSSARVRARLKRRELLLAMTKFGALQLNKHAQFYEEDVEFRQAASEVLMNLQNLSPDAQAMVDQLKFEVTGHRPRPSRVD